VVQSGFGEGGRLKRGKETEMKRIVLLIIASLLVIGLVLPGCAGGDGAEDSRPTKSTPAPE